MYVDGKNVQVDIIYLEKDGTFVVSGSGMDDLDNDLARSIDDHIDQSESLPFRYLNTLDLS
jgi:hypothetical protein